LRFFWKVITRTLYWMKSFWNSLQWVVDRTLPVSENDIKKKNC